VKIVSRQLLLPIKLLLLFWAAMACSNAIAGEFGMKPEANSEVVDAKNIEASLKTTQIVEKNNLVETPITDTNEALQLLADIRVHSAEELMQMLDRVDRLYLQGEVPPESIQPVVFLLHGDEARTLFKSQYREHKEVVDLAARLSAFGVVDIKVCERWAGNKGLDVSNLQPFVTTVPFAPEERRRLLDEKGYVYF